MKFGICHGADPNPNNIVAAGIVNTVSTGKVGCLIRIEPNIERQASSASAAKMEFRRLTKTRLQMIRLTIRCTSEQVADSLKSFLTRQLSQ